jgi:hypothetical protein
MLTSDTRDAEACVKEALGLAEAGCQIVRVTAQTRVIAENLQHIRDGIRAAGCDVPLVADIHFKPDAAMEAVKWVEKVRVNPGNYADKKKFAVKEYTDDEYAAEVAYMEEQFVPLVKECIRLEPRHAHRHESRLPQRPHHEPPWRHAARHGGERPRIRPHRPCAGLSQLPLLDEGQQSEGHDRGLSTWLLVAHLNPEFGFPSSIRHSAPTGTIRSISASPKLAMVKTAASRAPSASDRCSPMASATPCAFL